MQDPGDDDHLGVEAWEARAEAVDEFYHPLSQSNRLNMLGHQVHLACSWGTLLRKTGIGQPVRMPILQQVDLQKSSQ